MAIDRMTRQQRCDRAECGCVRASTRVGAVGRENICRCWPAKWRARAI